jgi:hypothetical protein
MLNERIKLRASQIEARAEHAQSADRSPASTSLRGLRCTADSTASSPIAVLRPEVGCDFSVLLAGPAGSRGVQQRHSNIRTKISGQLVEFRSRRSSLS